MNGSFSQQKALMGTTVCVVICVFVAIIVALATRTDDKPTDPEAFVTYSPAEVDPYLIAQSTLMAAYSHNPKIDNTPFDGLSRIKNRLTGNLYHVATHPPAGEEAAKLYPREWEIWKQYGDKLIGFAQETPGQRGDNEPQSPLIIEFEVTQKVIHSDGEQTPYGKFIAEVEMVLIDGSWKASNYTVTTILQ